MNVQQKKNTRLKIMDFKKVKEECPHSWEALKEWFRALDFIPADKVAKIKVKSEYIDLFRANGRIDRIVLKDLYGFFDGKKIYVGVYPEHDTKFQLTGFAARVTSSVNGSGRQRGSNQPNRDAAEKTAFKWAFQRLEAQLSSEQKEGFIRVL